MVAILERMRQWVSSTERKEKEEIRTDREEGSGNLEFRKNESRETLKSLYYITH